MRRFLPALLVVLCTCSLSARALAQAPPNVPLAGGVWGPPVAAPGQLIQVGFSLQETAGTPTSFDALALAVLGPGGTFVKDAILTGPVVVDAQARYHLTDTTRLDATLPPGDYSLVARGRYQGIWFDFPAASVQNPRPMRVQESAFAAVIPRISLPPLVHWGTHPDVSAQVQNTSTFNSGYNGDASFVVDARVTRGSTVVGEQTWPLERFTFLEQRDAFAFTQALDTSVPGWYVVRYRVRTYSSDPANLRDTFAVREAAFEVRNLLLSAEPNERLDLSVRAVAAVRGVRVDYDLRLYPAATVQVFDVLGRERARTDVQGSGQVHFDVDAAGLYLVRAEPRGGVPLTRTVVVR